MRSSIQRAAAICPAGRSNFCGGGADGLALIGGNRNAGCFALIGGNRNSRPENWLTLILFRPHRAAAAVSPSVGACGHIRVCGPFADGRKALKKDLINPGTSHRSLY
jgi:hypothetical protein